MKTPRYRYWSYTNKVMVEWEHLAIAMFAAPICTAHHSVPPHFHLSAAFDKLAEEGVFLEWTGLKDKNGKDIHVGHILRFVYDTAVGKVADVGVMEFNHTMAQFGMNKMMDDKFMEKDHIVSKEIPEIIGDIYQTPNLIPKT